MKAMALEVFRILSGPLGEDPAGKVVEYMEEVREVAEKAEQRAEGLATRAELKADLADVKTELKAEIANVKVELKAEIASVKADMATKADLNVKIAQTKADLIKWMFIFWITQTLTILGLLVYFLGRPAV